MIQTLSFIKILFSMFNYCIIILHSTNDYHAKIANDFDFFRLHIYRGCC